MVASKASFEEECLSTGSPSEQEIRPVECRDLVRKPHTYVVYGKRSTKSYVSVQIPTAILRRTPPNQRIGDLSRKDSMEERSHSLLQVHNKATNYLPLIVWFEFNALLSSVSFFLHTIEHLACLLLRLLLQLPIPRLLQHNLHLKSIV